MAYPVSPSNPFREASSPPPLPVISPSSIADLDCSKKFWITRVLKQWPPKATTTPHASAEFGTAFHAVMSNLYRDSNLHYESFHNESFQNSQEHPCVHEEKSKEGKAETNKAGSAGTLIPHGTWIPLPVFSPDMRHLEALTRQAFHARRYPSRAGREEDIRRCMEMVTNYVEGDPEEDIAGTIAVERWGEFLIRQGGRPLFLLSGKLDRVLVRAGEPDRLIVRDYKTGNYKTGNSKTSSAAQGRRVKLSEAFVLLWVARLCFPGYSRYALEYEWVDPEGWAERDVIEGSDLRGQHGWLLSRLQSILASARHPAEPGDACAFCALRLECQPLREAAASTGMDI